MIYVSDIAEIEKVLNFTDEDFENIWGWSIDNKLNLHFGNDKTKYFFFPVKGKAENIRRLNIRYEEMNIKQETQVTYLGCVLDNWMSGEPMALKVINKINMELKFFYRKNKFLILGHWRMLCVPNLEPKFYRKNKNVNTNDAKY